MKRSTSALVTVVLCLGVTFTAAQEEVGPTYKHLKDLELFAGDWELQGTMITGDERQDISLIASYRWIQNKAFMLMTLQETQTKELLHVAVIGWDPDKNHIMSWEFNLLGTIFSYYQGRSDKGWWHKGNGRSPDGATSDLSGLHTVVDDNTMDYKTSGTIHREGNNIPVTVELKAKRIVTIQGLSP